LVLPPWKERQEAGQTLRNASDDRVEESRNLTQNPLPDIESICQM
jgi:hypothetical protein